jgi:hypothetical protein
MIGVDSNILVYAHREDQAWFDAAVAAIRDFGRFPALRVRNPLVLR